MEKMLNGVVSAKIAFRREVLYAYVNYDGHANVRLRCADDPDDQQMDIAGVWHSIPFVAGAADCSVKIEDSEHGVLFLFTGKFRVPLWAMHSADGEQWLAHLCRRLKEEYVIMVYTDGSGMQWLAGTINAPLKCSVGLLEQSDAADFRGYEFTFKGQNEDMPAPLLPPLYNDGGIA